MVNNLRNYKFQPSIRLSFFLAGIFIMFLILVTLQQANPLTTRLGRDSGIYIYVSNTLLKGEVPYISALETKPPGIFFIDAFALWIGHGTRWGIWLIEFIYLFASGCIGFYLFHRQFGFGPALIASAVWLLGLKLTLEGGNLTEEYSLLFGFCALLFWRLSEQRSNVFWLDAGIGICMGCSFILRPNNTGVQIAIILVMIFFHVMRKDYQSLFKRLIAIFVAAAIPVAVSGLFFYAFGALDVFFQAAILYNLSYTGGNIDLRGAFLGGIGNLGFSCGIALAGYFVALQKLRNQFVNKDISSFLLWLAVNGILELFLSSLSGRGYQHYFICWLVAVASATAILIYYVFPDFCLWTTKYASTFALASIGLVFLLYSSVLDGYVESAKRKTPLVSAREWYSEI